MDRKKNSANGRGKGAEPQQIPSRGIAGERGEKLESGSRLEYLLKEKFKLGPTMISELHNVSWETLANLSHTFKVKIDDKRSNLRIVERQVEMTKLLITEKLRDRNPQFDAKFYLDLVRLLEKMETMAIEYEVNIDEFLLFLYLLIEKMKRERLVVYDPGTQSYRAPRKGEGEFDRYKLQH